MSRRPFRDALLVLAPAALLLAGLASIDHRQRLVEAGYRVGTLEKHIEALEKEIRHRRAVVGRLSGPLDLAREVHARGIPLDYPRNWNEIRSDGEADRLVRRTEGPDLALEEGARR
ncbi:MAG: hypothetical protein ACYTDX_04030 [Planctomycetota bacterium]|jgi:hypothetical protein